MQVIDASASSSNQGMLTQILILCTSRLNMDILNQFSKYKRKLLEILIILENSQKYCVL